MKCYNRVSLIIFYLNFFLTNSNGWKHHTSNSNNECSDCRTARHGGAQDLGWQNTGLQNSKTKLLLGVNHVMMQNVHNPLENNIFIMNK